MACGCVNDRMFMFGWTAPLSERKRRFACVFSEGRGKDCKPMVCSEISAELWEGSGMGQGQGSKQTHLLRCTHTAEGL